MADKSCKSRKTILYETHVAAGAKMVDFAGFLMPIQYPAGIVAEHLSTRKACGMFDVSHMGRFIFRGSGSLAFLQRLLTNDAAKLTVGDSHYTLILDANGAAIDDAWLYRFLEDEYVLVVNAANADKDKSHFEEQLAGVTDVEMDDAGDRLAMISVQGPISEEVLSSLVKEGELPAPKRNSLSIVKLCGVDVMLARTGYTGEPVCFEMIFCSDAAGAIWKALVDAGAVPVGLGARDTLRLEAGLPLYGHEYGADPDGNEIPVMAYLAVRFGMDFSTDRDFIGRAVLERQHNVAAMFAKGDFSNKADLPVRIRQFALLGRGIARAGCPVLIDGKRIGVVTSGTMAPYWKYAETCEAIEPTEESSVRAIGMAAIDSEIPADANIRIEIRGRAVAAKIVARNLDNRTEKFAVPLIYKQD